MAAIEIVGVTKTFAAVGGPVTALDDISLAVPQGGVFGLLGPNGSGKSTLLRVICGLVHADRGHVAIAGQPADVATRRQIRVLIDSPLFYPFLSGREVLRTLARTSRVTGNVAALLDRVNLTKAADRPVASYSLGMKQRLGIAAALIADPPMVILDEPTNGLDPSGIIQIRYLIRHLAEKEGRTVLVSSHLLSEMERTCDRVAILRSGTLAAEGQVGNLLSGERLLLQVGQTDAALAILGDRGVREADGIMIAIGRDEAPELFRRMTAAGIDIYEARWIRRSLEDLFQLHLQGAER